MIVSDAAVDKRVGVLVLAVVILVFGLVSYNGLPRESSPDITIPYIFVSTPYPGVAPADVEKTITIPIEKKLKGLENVKKITSVSSTGYSSIVIEFVTGTDIDEVRIKVKDKVDEAKPDLPSDLEDEPQVTEINISEMPILVLSLSGPSSLVRLKQIADDLQEDIESIPGVLEAEVSGGLEREIKVEPAPEKLAYYGISLVSLQTVISSENKNTSGGAIRMGDGRFQLRVPGEFKTPEEIYGLVVGLHQGGPIYLKDVARVVDGFKDEASRSRLNGQRSVNVMVKKRSGENIVSIVDQVKALVAKSQKTWPRGTEVTILMDQAKEVRIMVADLENNIISGLILVVAVLFLFLGFRNALLVAMAIPFSMFLSFIVLSLMGITLNMVVLFSLTLALGMLVDNAIVIVENIYRYTEQGLSRVQAAKLATGEVAYPVIGSTATTVAAFFPLITWPGIMGEFMSYLPITLIITLTSSLFVAMVINPAMAAIFVRPPRAARFRAGTMTPEEVQRACELPTQSRSFFLRIYRAILGSALNHRVPVLILSFAVLAILAQVWLLRVGLEKPVEFFPSIDPQEIYVNLDMPEGADLEYSDRVARQVEAIVTGSFHGQVPPPNVVPRDIYMQHGPDRQQVLGDGRKVVGITDLPNVEYIYSKTVATVGGGSVFEQTSPNHIGVQFYDMAERTEKSTKTVEKIRQRAQKVPGAKITVAARRQGPPTGAPINIEISGDNFRVLGSIARQIRQILEKVPFVEDIKDDYMAGSPTVEVHVDRQRAAMMGLSTETIGFLLKVAYNGFKVSTYREGDEDYDITVQLPENQRRVTDILRELLIPTTNGSMVPLSTLAKFEITGGLGRINRINHQRTVTVKANADEDKIPGAVLRAQAEEMLSHFPLPPGYSIKFTGESEEQQEAQEFLTKAFGAAIFLILLILITQFNSIMQPLIIITSVILSLGGVFLGLTVMNYPFGIIMTGVGVISLAGVVVNNAIVLIDYINKLRDRGLELREAIIAAGCTRLRPVLLTAVTTILGLIPMVTGVSYDFHLMEISWKSESTQWWSSMAAAVIFGLSLATVLTLVVVPTLYSLVESVSSRWNRTMKWTKRTYWAPYYRLTKTKPLPGDFDD